MAYSIIPVMISCIAVFGFRRMGKHDNNEISAVTERRGRNDFLYGSVTRNGYFVFCKDVNAVYFAEQGYQNRSFGKVSHSALTTLQLTTQLTTDGAVQHRCAFEIIFVLTGH